MTGARQTIVDDVALRGRVFANALSDVTDAWLVELLHAATTDLRDIALVATGGYGRRELAPGSDLDVMLVHRKRNDIAQVAERLWYPIWDTKLKLGHAVRTVKDALKLAADDVDTATSLLSVRHLAGDTALTDDLSASAVQQWRKRGSSWLIDLDRAVRTRHAHEDEVAFLLEPNLKEGRGGLRDLHALVWAHTAAGRDRPTDLDDDYETLLAARIELHRATGRSSDVLTLADQDAVAERLGYSDADALMASIANSSRAIGWASDEAWASLVPSAAAKAARDHPVASGIVVRDGAVELDASADPAVDPAVVLRLATAAARLDLRIGRGSLDRLVETLPVFPDPWPAGAIDELLALFLTGRAAIDVIEMLDARNLFVRVLPEWEVVRCKPQRNAFHRFTVDRHLLETIANAAELSSQTSRPDLLLLGALFHDLGKGRPGDHSEVGVELVRLLGPRLDLDDADIEIISTLTRHHLLLPEVATRRDISDDMTITNVAEQVGNRLTLEVLHLLTEADGRATGPSAWGTWKAELVRDLAARVDHVLGGGEVHDVAWSLFPSPDVAERMGAKDTSIVGDGQHLTVVAPDRPGLFATVAGVVSLHGLDVIGAQAHSDDFGMAANQFTVLKRTDLDWKRVCADLELALDGRLALSARIAERATTYSRRRKATSARPMVSTKVIVENDASSNATVFEVHCPDSIGVLYRITRALAELRLDIRHAKIATLGSEVVDSFYVRDSSGAKITDPAYIREIERAILHAAA
jgi:[protein-PII] uridylyltransferase